jgi:chromosome segregation ATPase
MCSQQITVEIQNASLEHKTLHKRLNKLQHRNNKLKKKLQNFQEEEDDKGLDDMLDSMEAKIKALKSRPLIGNTNNITSITNVQKQLNVVEC